MKDDSFVRWMIDECPPERIYAIGCKLFGKPAMDEAMRPTDPPVYLEDLGTVIRVSDANAW